MFAPVVKVKGLAFGDRKCDREFRHKRSIKRKQLGRLADCMAAAWWRPRTGTSGGLAVDSSKTEWEIRFSHGLTIRLVPPKDGRVTIAAIELDEDAVEGPEGVEVVGGMASDGDPNGVVDGRVGGIAGGLPPPPPPPRSPRPPPPPGSGPQMVAPTALAALRTKGDSQIAPDEDTKVEMLRNSIAKVVASFKLCVKDTGEVKSVAQLKSSGFPAYDQKLIAGIKTWEYTPFVLNGKPAPVCTAVTFIYTQQ
jgi:hypothetical protein